MVKSKEKRPQKPGAGKGGSKSLDSTTRPAAGNASIKEPSQQWPRMQPLVPSSDLYLDVVVPGQILTVSNFWTSTLCKAYVGFLASLPMATTPGKPKRGEAVRVNDRYQVADAWFADQLWRQTSLKELVEGYEPSPADGNMSRDGFWGGEVVGLNPNIRIYRYSKGQFFDQHYDESNSVSLPTDPPTNARTTWTLLLYLTSPATGCVGGETVFYPDPVPGAGGKGKKATMETPEPVVINLETGMALLHKHGNDCLLHEAREVTQGEKWVIRSDLCVKR